MLVLVLLVSSSGGCCSVSIATNTGNRREGAWSTAPRQEAHVGETIEFSVMLTQPLTGSPVHGRGAADYCVLYFGDRRVEWDLDLDGRFHGQHTFEMPQVGETIRVTAEVYLKRAARDYMEVRGEWLRNESPHDGPDELVGRGAVELSFYQSELRMAVPRPAGEYDASTATLVLRRLDGGETTLFPERPPRRGFTMTEQPDGTIEIAYRPLAAEVSPYGATEAEFSIYNAGGAEWTQRHVLLTP